MDPLPTTPTMTASPDGDGHPRQVSGDGDGEARLVAGDVGISPQAGRLLAGAYIIPLLFSPFPSRVFLRMRPRSRCGSSFL
jgi:hypothetical protein